jgi:hypothetical protein
MKMRMKMRKIDLASNIAASKVGILLKCSGDNNIDIKCKVLKLLVKDRNDLKLYFSTQILKLKVIIKDLFF